MPNFLTGLPIKATGNIGRSVFVTGDTTTPFGVKQATTGDDPLGVSQAGTLSAPNIANAMTLNNAGSADSGYAAVAGSQLTLYLPGDICWLSIGSGGCTPWAKLKPDVNGRGIIASSADKYGAIAFTNASLGDLTSVLVWKGVTP